jgi:hypothetical protein
LINIVRKAEEKMNEQRCLKLIDIVSYLNQWKVELFLAFGAHRNAE